MEKAQAQGKWNWIICNLPLKQIINGENTQWTLQPSIALSHPSGQGPDPNIKLLVDTEKSFQYSEELGWNWHKSWKLPTISVQLEITDVETNEILLCPKDIFVLVVHIFAVKPLVDSNNKLYLADVGLKGSNKLELIDGKASFQTLKFASTSYNNEGVKFHLLICLYLQISEDTKPKMLKAIVSPPIFVDSRKSVRETEKFNENKLHLYIDPFFPDNFTKKFIKRETKKKESIEEDIQNSIEGLYSYLTAPNIRHKKSNFVEVLQNLLFDDMDRVLSSRDIKAEESVFLMYIDKDALEDKAKKKKILELLSPVRCRSLTVAFSKAEIPNHFVQFTDLKWMIELYSKSYSRLIARAKNYSKDEEPEDEEPPEKTAPPERQVINLAHDNVPSNSSDWSKYLEASLYDDEPKKKLKNDSNSAAPNMMEARTISYKENAAKQKNDDKVGNNDLTNPLVNLGGINNTLLLNLLQNKTPDASALNPNLSNLSQLTRGLTGNTNPILNPLQANTNSLASRVPNTNANRPSMDPILMIMMQNKMNQQLGNQRPQMPTNLPSNLPSNIQNPVSNNSNANIQQNINAQFQQLLQKGGLNLNANLLSAALGQNLAQGAPGNLQVKSENMNLLQNPNLQLLQNLANIGKPGNDVVVKHEDNTNDPNKK